MIIIVSFLSFILDFVFNYFLMNTLFLPLICLISIIILRPYFKKNIDLYYVFCFVIGFLYDFIYTGNYFMNAGLFLIVGILISFINKNMPNNIFVSIFEVILIIFLYRVMSYLFFFLNGIVSFSFHDLLKSIYCSFALNVIYGIFLYLILYFVSKKFKIERIN
jgi:rod shape-determining protein MreD